VLSSDRERRLRSEPDRSSTDSGGGGRAPLLESPRLRTDEDRTASRLELFFDLAYVLVVAQLTAVFAEDLTGHGAVVFAGLFTATWWSWVTTTLYANRFDTNDVPYRLAKLGQTFAVAVMAAAASGAVGEHDRYFALGYLGTRVILLGLYLRAYRHVAEARRTLTVYLAAGSAGVALWSASLLVDGPARYLLWAAGVAVEALAPPLATWLGDDVPLQGEHLPERFGLFAMLVLGESVASVVVGLDETDWRPASFVAAAVGFLIAAALWWSYFDIGGAAGKRQLERDQDTVSTRHDRYIYGHLPLFLGLAAVGIGIEQYVLHPAGDLAPGGRLALPLGATLFVVGVTLVMAGSARRWSASWPWPVLAVPLLVGISLLGRLSPLLTACCVAGVLLVTVVTGIVQQVRGRLETSET
jgi:low temperature requirement protein LtrA